MSLLTTEGTEKEEMGRDKLSCIKKQEQLLVLSFLVLSVSSVVTFSRNEG